MQTDKNLQKYAYELCETLRQIPKSLATHQTDLLATLNQHLSGIGTRYIDTATECRLTYAWVYLTEFNQTPPTIIQRAGAYLEIQSWFDAFPCDSLSRFTETFQLMEKYLDSNIALRVASSLLSFPIQSVVTNYYSRLDCIYNTVLDILMGRCSDLAYLQAFSFNVEEQELDNFTEKMYNILDDIRSFEGLPYLCIKLSDIMLDISYSSKLDNTSQAKLMFLAILLSNNTQDNIPTASTLVVLLEAQKQSDFMAGITGYDTGLQNIYNIFDTYKVSDFIKVYWVLQSRILSHTSNNFHTTDSLDQDLRLARQLQGYYNRRLFDLESEGICRQTNL